MFANSKVSKNSTKLRNFQNFNTFQNFPKLPKFQKKFPKSLDSGSDPIWQSRSLRLGGEGPKLGDRLFRFSPGFWVARPQLHSFGLKNELSG